MDVQYQEALQISKAYTKYLHDYNQQLFTPLVQDMLGDKLDSFDFKAEYVMAAPANLIAPNGLISTNDMFGIFRLLFKPKSQSNNMFSEVIISWDWDMFNAHLTVHTNHVADKEGGAIITNAIVQLYTLADQINEDTENLVKGFGKSDWVEGVINSGLQTFPDFVEDYFNRVDIDDVEDIDVPTKKQKHKNLSRVELEDVDTEFEPEEEVNPEHFWVTGKLKIEQSLDDKIVGTDEFLPADYHTFRDMGLLKVWHHIDKELNFDYFDEEYVDEDEDKDGLQ